MSPIVQQFTIDSSGRSFAVGDIHGSFDILEDKLLAVEFDGSKDQLFFLGDLVNRGNFSPEFSNWLKKPYVHSIRGNHEQACLWYLDNRMDANELFRMGGQWLVNQIDHSFYPFIKQSLSSLPLAIEIKTSQGIIVLAHANITGNSWYQFKEVLINEDESSDFTPNRDVIMWDKSRFKTQNTTIIDDIRALVVGHSKTRYPVVYGNTYFIDTGAVWSGKFTLLELNTLTFY